MDYYVTKSKGIPNAVFRYDPSTRVAEKYTRKTKRWVRTWFLMAQFMSGNMGPGDKISEEEALRVIEGFG